MSDDTTINLVEIWIWAHYCDIEFAKYRFANFQSINAQFNKAISFKSMYVFLRLGF